MNHFKFSFHELSHINVMLFTYHADFFIFTHSRRKKDQTPNRADLWGRQHCTNVTSVDDKYHKLAFDTILFFRYSVTIVTMTKIILLLTLAWLPKVRDRQKYNEQNFGKILEIISFFFVVLFEFEPSKIFFQYLCYILGSRMPNKGINRYIFELE